MSTFRQLLESDLKSIVSKILDDNGISCEDFTVKKSGSKYTVELEYFSNLDAKEFKTEINSNKYSSLNEYLDDYSIKDNVVTLILHSIE